MIKKNKNFLRIVETSFFGMGLILVLILPIIFKGIGVIGWPWSVVLIPCMIILLLLIILAISSLLLFFWWGLRIRQTKKTGGI